MFRSRSARVCILGAGSLIGMALFASCAVTDTKDTAEIPPPIAADSQAQALKLARTVDLPLLEKADRVVLQEAAISKGKSKERRVVLKKPEQIKELRQTLEPQETPPSGGQTAVTLTFYRGDDVLRKIWVYAKGEWGVQRPGTSWTTGRSAALWAAIEKSLK